MNNGERLNGILDDLNKQVENAKSAILNLPVEEMNVPAEKFIEIMKRIQARKEN